MKLYDKEVSCEQYITDMIDSIEKVKGVKLTLKQVRDVLHESFNRRAWIFIYPRIAKIPIKDLIDCKHAIDEMISNGEKA